MKRILIYMSEDELKPVGGPSGYVWNINKALGGNYKVRDLEISFLPKNISKYNKVKNMLKVMFPQIVKKRDRNRYLKLAKNVVLGEKHTADINLNEYDAIYFHSTYRMYCAKDSLESYTGKVIITSHSPKALHKEFIEDYMDEDIRVENSELLSKLYVMDEYSFNRADIIVFPCVEAEEPYYHSWSEYNNIHLANSKKYRYLATGCLPKTVKKNADEVRSELGIPMDAFIVCYVGRHNETKGYDELKRIAEKMIGDESVYFLVAGKEGPLFGLNNSRWIEYGWTDDAGSLINTSDVFVLPNKETYFDLVLLEVLSIGTPVVASDTGGNKYINKLGTKGVRLYQSGNIEQAISQILYFKSISDDEYKDARISNNSLYKKYFTMDVFMDNFLTTIMDSMN